MHPMRPMHHIYRASVWGGDDDDDDDDDDEPFGFELQTIEL